MTPPAIAIERDPWLHESDFYTAMLDAGWLPVYQLFGNIPYWRHERTGRKLVFWRSAQREYAVTGEMPIPF